MLERKNINKWYQSSSLDEYETDRQKIKHKFSKNKKIFTTLKGNSFIIQFKLVVINYLASQLPQKDIMVLGQIFMSIDENKDGYLTVE